LTTTAFRPLRFLWESKRMTARVGTSPYIAPEVWFNEDYTQQADVFAYGTVLYEMSQRAIPGRVRVPSGEMAALWRSDWRLEIRRGTPTSLSRPMRPYWSAAPHELPTIYEIFRAFAGGDVVFNGGKKLAVQAFAKQLTSDDASLIRSAGAPVVDMPGAVQAVRQRAENVHRAAIESEEPVVPLGPPPKAGVRARTRDSMGRGRLRRMRSTLRAATRVWMIRTQNQRARL